MVKTKATSGADEKTPSVPQYFSWINSTNEGSTEEQTLINLEYFRWLKDTYGMQIEIYAWDAGNFDTPGFGYEDPYTSKKLKKQYPNGYGPCVERAKELGIRMGLWGGADGFGETEADWKKRRDVLVNLCRDFNIREIKIDTACDWLRPEMRQYFKETIDMCRKYVPDLLILNHRHMLGDAEICVSTFLHEGVETYIDVLTENSFSGPHHRMAPLVRDLVPGMQRLAEDHGVCISSCPDFFEDDMIVQAFSRSLIVSPEVYGNPWFLRDDEQARLAKIYNLHAEYDDILMNGFPLPEEKYGKNAVSRGNGCTRLLTFTNPTWTNKNACISPDESIGLDITPGKRYAFKILHPYEEFLGFLKPDDKAFIDIAPGRASLILVQESEKFLKENFALTGCRYETVYGPGRVPSFAKIYSSCGHISSVGNRTAEADTASFDNTLHAPVALGRLSRCDMPANSRAIYEATAFSANCDSLESQSIKRSGDTKVPEVRAARDAFFAQATYLGRGPESAFMFDGKDDTYFDGTSRQSSFFATPEWQEENLGKVISEERFEMPIRVNGGCLRADLGQVYDVSEIEIISFSIGEPKFGFEKPNIESKGFTSSDLSVWEEADLICSESMRKDTCRVTKDFGVIDLEGDRISTRYRVGGRIRYFELPRPMDRIYSFRVYDRSGAEIKIPEIKVNNMLSVYGEMHFTYAAQSSVRLPDDYNDGSYIAVGTDGRHGYEGVYCALEFGGKLIGAFDRAPSFPFNKWEHETPSSPSGLTYYFRATPEMKGKNVTLYALYRDIARMDEISTAAWLCDSNVEKSSIRIDL
ncbi:MAG: hypothetical protein IJU57_00830 [Clostridia bacterium]|nr:hypothetical protein [Clostridia bacterium]